MAVATGLKLYEGKEPIYRLSQNNSKALAINTIEIYRTWMKKNAKTHPRRNSVKMSILPTFIYGCNTLPVQIRFVLGSGQEKSEKEEQEENRL